MSVPAAQEHPLAPLDDPFQPPTRGRYGVLAFLGGMTFVLYLDRVCIGQAGSMMQAELNITNSQMGNVLAAFTLAYGLFEVPIGRLGDRWGARGVLTRIVIWWSVFTCLTGMARSYWSLLAIRFLFGAGEAGALPNTARILSRWFPESSRGMAQGTVTTCMMIGGAVSPTAAAWLITHYGWRESFWVFGLLGLFWSAGFWYWYRDDPAQHPAVNAAERKLIEDGRVQRSEVAPPIPWARVLTNPNVWLMGLLMTCSSSVYYMMISWYSTYLQKARLVPQETAGWLTSMVLAGGAVGCICGGRIMDVLIRRTNDRRRSRSRLAVCALSVSALTMWLGVYADRPVVSAACMSIACLSIQLQIPAWWSTVTQISGRHIGAMFGLMNSLGVPGAAASQKFIGVLADTLLARGYVGRAAWDPALYIYGGVMIFAALLWLFVNPDRAIDDPQEQGETA